jgi:ABC-2 type transport system permease protein
VSSNPNGFKWSRVRAVLVRQWYGTIRNFDRLSDSFYWILIDLILWGITAGYVQDQIASGERSVFFVIISGVIMWAAVYRSQMDIGMGLLDELWNKNLINLFASPLKFSEWIVSLLIFSFIKAATAVAFGCMVAWLLYDFALISGLTWYLVPLFLVLVLNGWWIGLMIQAIIMRLTTKAQSLAWTLVWVLAPFSVSFFPLSSIPPFAQVISTVVPTSYVFEEMRGIIAGASPNWGNLIFAAGLSVAYIAIAVILVNLSFKRVLGRGLAKIY